MARLTEEMVIARSKQSDLSAIKKLNCWGAELGDVSLLRRMPNVEVLALSINKIRTLCDFAGCRRLRELYVRKNEIRSLAEIRHLRHLPDLTSLWLDENPCTDHPEYRMTVLRNLPHLEKLDNVAVNSDEVAEAMRRGALIPDSDDEGYPSQQESFGQYRLPRSADSSPERGHHPYISRNTTNESSEGSEPGADPGAGADNTQTDTQACSASPDSDERYEHPAMTRSAYDTAPVSRVRSPDADASLRHSYSAQSVKEYVYCNGGGGARVTSPPHHHHHHDPYTEKPDRCDVYQQAGARPGEWEQDRASARERERCTPAPAPAPPEYPSAVMAEHRGFTRRPVARNSNLLSAVLCLVKELDYAALEVAEMAVRRDTRSRMSASMCASSSGSWSGGGGGGGEGRADILDLDRYMRAGVRQPRPRHAHNTERLVVDGGGIERKVGDVTTTGNTARYKRFSHDSGLSDDSYITKRMHKPHRRTAVSVPDDGVLVPREPPSVRTLGIGVSGAGAGASSDSLRHFRATCQQALLDQQKQIARVAQLCERLTRRAEDERVVKSDTQPSRHLDNIARIDRLNADDSLGRNLDRTLSQRKTMQRKRNEKVEKVERTPSVTSDLSSSSRSTDDLKRKEKHRAQECKTYKIIMSKLDELNARLPTRRRPLARSRTPPPPSSSVSVCDKLVATDSPRPADKIISPTKTICRKDDATAVGASDGSTVQARSCPCPRPRVIAQAFSVDISPREALKMPNVITENVVKHGSSCGSGSGAGDPRCGFHLEDPVRVVGAFACKKKPSCRPPRCPGGCKPKYW